MKEWKQEARREAISVAKGEHSCRGVGENDLGKGHRGTQSKARGLKISAWNQCVCTCMMGQVKQGLGLRAVTSQAQEGRAGSAMQDALEEGAHGVRKPGFIQMQGMN